MNWIKLTVNKGEVNGVLELDKLSNEHKSSLINGFFRVFGAAETVAPAAPKNEAEPITVVLEDLKKSVSNALAAPLVSSHKTVLPATPSQPKLAEIVKPALINSERSLNIPLGEKFTALNEKLSAAVESVKPAVQKEQKDWWVTGIKYKDSVPHYRCRYYCSCKGKGSNDYIRLDASEVTCHNCGQRLAVRLATGEYDDLDKGIPARDEWGNYFIADHPVEEF